jgi:hypothetical protein
MPKGILEAWTFVGLEQVGYLRDKAWAYIRLMRGKRRKHAEENGDE